MAQEAGFHNKPIDLLSLSLEYDTYEKALTRGRAIAHWWCTIRTSYTNSQYSKHFGTLQFIHY